MTIYSRQHNGKKQWQYRVYYSDINGDRKQKNSKWFNTRKDAVTEEAVFLQRKAEKPKSNLTFLEVCNLWQENNKRTNKASTVYSMNVFIKMMEPLFNKKIEDITAIDIDNFFESKHIMSMKYSTRKHLMVNLKTVFHFAQKKYDIQNNPFNKVSPLQKPSEYDQIEMEIVKPDTFKKFYEAMSEYSNGAWVETARLYWLLYMTGMRIGECISLTFNDFDGKYIHVRRQYIQRLQTWQSPKTPNSIRKIAIDEKSKQMILDQLHHYEKMPKFDKSWFIFGGYKYNSIENTRRRKNLICDLIGIKRFKAHSLRHSHVSNLIEAGVNPYKISKRLGHSSIKTTMDVYGHLLDTEEQDILNSISDF